MTDRQPEPFLLKLSWQVAQDRMNTVADALRAGGIKVIDAHLTIDQGTPKSWITIEIAGGQAYRVTTEMERVYLGDRGKTPVHIGGAGGYSLPPVTGKVADEVGRVFSRFHNLDWSNPVEDQPTSSQFERWSKSRQVDYLKAELAIHLRMFEQAYQERKAQVPDDYAEALEEANRLVHEYIWAPYQRDLERGIVA